MLRAVDVANYFLEKDPDRAIFDKTLINKNNRTFYQGNARLNKYLHMAQNVYLATTGEKLFNDDLYAYDNGAVVPSVQENYAILVQRHIQPSIDPTIASYLDKIYTLLSNATLDELIAMSHEDDAWIEKQNSYFKENQKMDSVSKVEQYRHQYADVLSVMDKMK